MTGNPSAKHLVDRHGRSLANSFFYEGVKQGRERRYLPLYAADSKHTLTPATRTELLALSRYLVTNVGLVRGAIRDMATYSIGTGLQPQSQTPGKDDADLLESYFWEWGKQADASGRHSFCALQSLLCQAVDVDGDIGAAMHAPTRESWGQLQVIEGHRIASPDEAGSRAGTDSATWIDGLQVDALGRAMNYSVREATGRDGKDSFRTVPARDFIFLYDPDRADQYRGYTALVHAIPHVRDITDIISYEKVGVKMASGIGVAIKTQSGAADSGTSYIENGYTAAQTVGLPWETWQAGMVPRLKIGESIDSFASNRPSPAFMGFMEFLIRDVAVGLGLPFEFIWDLAKAKGSGSRAIFAKAQRRFEQRQELFVNRLLNRVWFWAIGRAIDRGDLPASPRWWDVRWQAPAKLTMDLGKEAQANRDDLKYGNRTLQEDAAERGLDWQVDVRQQKEREVRDLLARANGLVEEFGDKGLTLDKALYLLSADSPNAPQLAVTTVTE